MEQVGVFCSLPAAKIHLVLHTWHAARNSSSQSERGGKGAWGGGVSNEIYAYISRHTPCLSRTMAVGHSSKSFNCRVMNLSKHWSKRGFIRGLFSSKVVTSVIRMHGHVCANGTLKAQICSRWRLCVGFASESSLFARALEMPRKHVMQTHCSCYCYFENI